MLEFVSLRAVLERAAHQHGTLQAGAKALCRCEPLKDAYDKFRNQSPLHKPTTIWLIDRVFGAQFADGADSHKAWELLKHVADTGDFKRKSSWDDSEVLRDYDQFGFLPEIWDVLSKQGALSRDMPAEPTGTAAPAELPAKSSVAQTHRLSGRKSNVLSGVIQTAKRNASEPDNANVVWSELVKLAEMPDPPAPLVGFSSDGVQYRGKNHQESGVPDIFTLKNLRDRMHRAAKRAKTR